MPVQVKGNWTDDRIEILKQLHAAGLSCSKIAAELGGVTRNAVIGKLHRLGIKTDKLKPQVTRGPAAIRNPRPARKPVNGLHIVNSARLPRETAGERETAAIAAATCVIAEPPLHIPFLDRRDPECGFICSADRAPATCCGHPQQTDSPYCPAHHRLTHQPEKPRGRRSTWRDAA